MATVISENAILSGAADGLWVGLIPPTTQKGFDAVCKRLLDIIVAAVCLLILAVPLAIIALLILKESGRPVIFAQQRIGWGGRRFTVYKFRSMAKDAEQRFDEVKTLNEVTDGPIFKASEDPRVTRIGRKLRRASLDELPQLWNVLNGTMSLVGPRPPLESEVLEYEDWQVQRLSAKPGMTGLWQVSGRSSLGFQKMVELDIDYIKKWSFLYDVLLLIKTIPVVLSRKGAY